MTCFGNSSPFSLRAKGTSGCRGQQDLQGEHKGSPELKEPWELAQCHPCFKKDITQVGKGLVSVSHF